MIDLYHLKQKTKTIQKKSKLHLMIRKTRTKVFQKNVSQGSNLVTLQFMENLCLRHVDIHIKFSKKLIRLD